MFPDSPILTAFCQNVQNFAETHVNYGFECIPEYGKSEDDLLSLTGRLYFSRFYFDFIYIIRSGGIVESKSVLKCGIWLTKGQNAFCHTLYDLQFLLDPGDFHCYTFPYIESPERMNQCFKTLAKAVELYLPRIAQIAEEPELVRTANEALHRDMATILPGLAKYTENFMEENIQFYTSWLDLHFTSSGYRAFLQGNYKKAIRWYRKHKKITAYEKRLLAFMQSLQPGETYEAVLSEQNSLGDGYQAEYGSSELPALLISWFCFTPVFLLLYVAVYYAAIYVINFGMLYSTGLPLYNALFMFLPAFLTSICISYYTRQKFYRLLYRKNKEKILAYDRILNTRGDEKVLHVFTRIVIIGCILFTVFTATQNVTFFSSHIVVRDSFFSLQGEEYPYSGIDSVWHISGRENAFGDWLENPSYVLLLQDGRKIDLYEYLDVPETEKNILPILQAREFVVKYAPKIDDVMLS